MQVTDLWPPSGHDSCGLRNGGFSGSPGPAKGYHTFTMTGDAIIWTSTAAPAAVAARSPPGLRNKAATAAAATPDGSRPPSASSAAAAALPSPGSILDAFSFDASGSFDGEAGFNLATAAQSNGCSPDAEAASAATAAAADPCSAKPDRYSEKEFLHGFIRPDECRVSDGGSAIDGELEPAGALAAASAMASAMDGGEPEPVGAFPAASAVDGGEREPASAFAVASQSNGPTPEPEGGVDILANLRSKDESLPAARANTVDVAAAQRLAKRLHQLEGFKRSDVIKHLGKSNDFSRAVSEEYFRFYDFANLSLVSAMRDFLRAHTLQGETYERERVLLQLSHRYVVCNPHLLAAPNQASSSAEAEHFSQEDAPFMSEDACHTLTCAIMLLNTDLHGQNIGKKMTMQEFVENLEGLNETKDYPKDLLRAMYQEIRDEPLSWPSDDVCEPSTAAPINPEKIGAIAEGSAPPPSPSPSLYSGNCFITPPDPTDTVEYKRGVLKRKCCIGPGGVKVSKGKRGWRAFLTVLRGAAIYFAKDEAAVASGLATVPYVRIHHALATAATDYKKSKYVMSLQTADQSTYLFQTRDQEGLEDWIAEINLVAATTSAPELPAPVGSQAKFRRPLLPSTITTLNLRDQLTSHESKLQQVCQSIGEHASDRTPAKGTSKALAESYADKEKFLQFEAERYRVYAELLRRKLAELPEAAVADGPATTPIGECEGLQSSPTQQQQQNANALSATISWKAENQTATDRYSYQQAIERQRPLV